MFGDAEFDQGCNHRDQDRDAGDGMTTTLGRLRRCPILSYKFVMLAHNTIRGAAGGSVLNAELCLSKGLIERDWKEKVP